MIQPQKLDDTASPATVSNRMENNVLVKFVKATLLHYFVMLYLLSVIFYRIINL